MLTSYEEQQLKLIKNWKYVPPSIIMQCQGIVFLPQPSIFRAYLPYDGVERILEMSSLQSQFPSDTMSFEKQNHIAVQELQEKGLEYSDGLVKQVCSSFEFSELKENLSSIIMDFLLDIPDILSFALRLIHQVGVCYGYEVESTADKNYLLAALLSVSGNPYEQETEICPSSLGNIHIRQLATKISLEVTMRKFIVQNPYLSIFVGKSAAKWYFKDIGMAAQRIFQKRWLIDHDKWE